MLFSLLKHYLDTDTSLKVSQSGYYFTTSISHGVENYFPRLWGTGISDAIFQFYITAFDGCVSIVCLVVVWWEKNLAPTLKISSGLFLGNRKV